MKRSPLLLVALAATLMPGITQAQPLATNFGTSLSGAEEVPPRDTRAHGEASFHLNDDGTMDFRLIVGNIRNVTAAHIHCAPPGSNGGVKQTLYGPVPAGGGPAHGVLAEGSFTPFTTPDAECGGLGLVDAMRAGLTYVNVHTDDGVAPTNSGPGDFPGGEIRGQIEAHGLTA